MEIAIPFLAPSLHIALKFFFCMQIQFYVHQDILLTIFTHFYHSIIHITVSNSHSIIANCFSYNTCIFTVPLVLIHTCFSRLAPCQLAFIQFHTSSTRFGIPFKFVLQIYLHERAIVINPLSIFICFYYNTCTLIS